jgi:putative endopeptidase
VSESKPEAVSGDADPAIAEPASAEPASAEPASAGPTTAGQEATGAAALHSGINAADADPSVRPQDDLFRHVNGHWFATTEIPEDRGRYGTFDMLREASERDVRALIEEAAAEGTVADDTAADDAAAAADLAPGAADRRKVADLYRSFMDEARVESLGTEPIEGLLGAVDGLASTACVPALLGRLQRVGVGGLVHTFVSTDDRDSDRYVVYLEQGGIHLPDESYYREGSYATVRESYVAHVSRMLALIGVDAAEEAAARVMALETRLAQSHWDKVANRDAVKTYTKLTLAELGEMTPGVDWAGWLNGLGAPEAAFDDVIARQPSFLSAMAQALADEPLPVWQDWLRWAIVHDLAPYLPAAFVDENFDFFGRQLSGMPSIRERWKRGVSLVEAALGEASGRLYVERHFPPAAKERMEALVANLVEAFRQDFQSLDWMGEATRQEALAKLSTFVPKIGYPAKWRDYSALSIAADDLVGNVARASAFELDRNLAKIGQPVDRDEWFMTPQTVNAYYNPGMNEIVFPAAILQPPFFDVTADDAVNYGAIGGVIGHEIGHGFDDQGSRFDGTGNLRDWWTAEDRARFDERGQKLIAQFNDLEPLAAPGHKINGALTVGENIGDLGGLTIGYKAYRIATGDSEPPVIDGLTGAQRFFMGWAQVWKGKARPEEALRLLAVDPHSPAEHRANVCRNLHEFHEAFGVTASDGMWLPEEERVRIF